MARGLQKIQSQQKNQAQKDKSKSAHDNKKSAQAGLLFQCVVCKVTFFYFFFLISIYSKSFKLRITLKAQLPDPKTYKQHFESKHPKAEMPDILKDVQA